MSGSESGETTETPEVTVPRITAETPKNPWASLGEGAKHLQLVTRNPLAGAQIETLRAKTGIDHVETGEDGLTNVLVTTREFSAGLVREILGADNVVSLEPAPPKVNP
ncbi:MAG: hypothetical protein WC843_06460 [Candidatus Gracilibacteria bacterium]|jgi:hypothetical protein